MSSRSNQSLMRSMAPLSLELRGDLLELRPGRVHVSRREAHLELLAVALDEGLEVIAEAVLLRVDDDAAGDLLPGEEQLQADAVVDLLQLAFRQQLGGH